MKIRITERCDTSIRIAPEDRPKHDGKRNVVVSLHPGELRDDLPDATAEKLIALGLAKKA